MPAKCIFSYSDKPDISIVVPSFDGNRGGNVEALVKQLKLQTYKSIEIILSIGESPNGHARNVGVEIARGEWLVFIDDDVTLEQDTLLTNLIEPLNGPEKIGMTGPSQMVPPDAGRFQRWCEKQIPRSYSPIVEDLTDSDMVTHMCLAMPKALFLAVGKESDWLLAGTDPDLRFRVRQAGYRVVVIPQTWAYHPAPENMAALIQFSYKKGSYSAWQYRFARDLAYDSPDGHVGNFKAKTTLVYRVSRKFVRIIRELVGMRPLGMMYDLSYITGYCHGLVRRWS